MKPALILLFAVLVNATLAERAPVVKPRSQAKEYSAFQESSGATIGAAQLSSKQIRKTFVSNLRKDYVVVEVGVFPKAELKLSPSDFSLRAPDTDKAISPSDPKTMAVAINEKDQNGTDLAIYPYEGITYTTGTAYDPSDPHRRDTHQSGVSTTSGVAVVMKPNARDPKTSAADKDAMAAELTEKSLPDREISRPVAGYLYFRVNGDRPATYQLEYRPSGGTNVLIPLTAPAD